MTPHPQQLGIIGAGAWGTALANTAARNGGEVLLWSYEPEVAADINAVHENRKYLPGIALAPNIRAVTDLAETAACEIVLLVTPAQASRGIAERLSGHLTPGTPVVICSKGIEISTGYLLSQVLAEALPEAEPMVLSGPSFAGEVANGLPTAVTLAAADRHLCEPVAERLSGPAFRLYSSDDVIGAEVGGAVKNVLAIACGIVEGRRLGHNASAALTARGFAEMTRLAVKLGARRETLSGLSGLGDLILTCGSRQSRNMSLGAAIGEGQSLEQIMAARQTVSEGVHTAQVIMKLAEAHEVEMPISAAVSAILHEGRSLDEVITGLLNRPRKSEHV
ncbi:MAG: glycerol-3-phosphate acyltransferase [Hyphomicrobiales bacterium]|nr:MAG: glycerol-3-phosphate acyltransferase [Hyphomicrobiales bacterium]